MTRLHFDAEPFETYSEFTELETARRAPSVRSSRPSLRRQQPPQPWGRRRRRPRRPVLVGSGVRSVLYDEPSPCICPVHGTEFVRWVQSSLNLIQGLHLPLDGVMSAATRSALRTFQRTQSLPADGIAGPETKEALLRARRGQPTPPQDAASQAGDTQPPDTEWEGDVLQESFWDQQTVPSNQPVLRRGSQGPVVTELQKRLAALGFNPGSADGIFGALTEGAVKTFQRSRGLPPDGIVGSQTWGPLLGLPSGSPATPGPVAGEPQVTISANAVVSDNAVRILKDILRAAGLTRATITSGRRTTNDQARIMYDLIERHGVSYAKTLYGTNGDKVIDVYDTLKRAGRSASAIKQAMASKITELGCHNVSHHCSDTHDVIDVAPSSIADAAAFRPALDAALKHGLIDKYIPPPIDPAFHIEIILNPTANELMSRILRSPPLPMDVFLPSGAQFEMD